VVNGLEVMEDERDAAMRADALKIVSSSALQALARLQFLRIAFGAAGSAGAELDVGEVGRLVAGLLEGGKVQLRWQSQHINWPKNWAKLLMNAALLGADCLPRGGVLEVQVNPDPAAPSFRITATSPHARVLDEVSNAVRGEAAEAHLDARGIQPYLTHKLSRDLNAGLTLTAREGMVELAAG
jgi:histidine phosphotransferase ChpT